MIAVAARLVLACLIAIDPPPDGRATTRSVPAPRVAVPEQQPTPLPRRARVAPARPGAVALVGVGALGLACGLSLIGVGAMSVRRFTDARTEGEAHAALVEGRKNMIVGGSLSVLTAAVMTGGIVWLIRDRLARRRTGLR